MCVRVSVWPHSEILVLNFRTVPSVVFYFPFWCKQSPPLLYSTTLTNHYCTNTYTHVIIGQLSVLYESNGWIIFTGNVSVLLYLWRFLHKEFYQIHLIWNKMPLIIIVWWTLIPLRIKLFSKKTKNPSITIRKMVYYYGYTILLFYLIV